MNYTRTADGGLRLELNPREAIVFGYLVVLPGYSLRGAECHLYRWRSRSWRRSESPVAETVLPSFLLLATSSGRKQASRAGRTFSKCCLSAADGICPSSPFVALRSTSCIPAAEQSMATVCVELHHLPLPRACTVCTTVIPLLLLPPTCSLLRRTCHFWGVQNR